MRVCLLTPDPGHPLLAATAALLAPDHRVESLDPTTGDTPPDGRLGPGPLADVYLLKARTPQALALARHLEERGAPVINSAAATAFCQDRTAMADLADRAGLPFAATRTAAGIAELAESVGPEDRAAGLAGAGPLPATGLRYPIVVKSRHSRRHDLVARVDGPEQLRALAARWPGEPVIAQPYLANTGWDQKLWVVDGQVFCDRRRSELAPGAGLPAGGEGRFGPAELPADRAALARRVGEVFGLDVYGVDLLDGPAEPVIVDVNAFPGIRGQAGAPEALAALALRAAARGGGNPRLPGRCPGLLPDRPAGQLPGVPPGVLPGLLPGQLPGQRDAPPRTAGR
ncbi:alpha-L-glutamate ligase [Kitasatospora sp. NPDC047058]|uniref:ATP-grasp domain-containing protein n=1 Tax=Kitasatospora sp. NPDC047058 TaxID=3155620 RepID=UPI0033FE604C